MEARRAALPRAGRIPPLLVALLASAALLVLPAAWTPRALAASGNIIDTATLPGLTTDRDAVFEVAAGPNGSVYVAGILDQTTNSTWMLVAKYDATRSLVWRRSYRPQGMTTVYSADIAVDRSGNVVVVGTADDGVDSDLLVAKWSAAGDLLWSTVRDGGTGKNDYANAVAVARNGSIYVAGDIDGSTRGIVLRYARAADADAPGSGLELWNHLIRGGGADPEAWAGAIVTDRSGNAYVTGARSPATHGEDAFTLKLSATGARRWLRAWDGRAHQADAGDSVALSGTRVYVAAETRTRRQTGNVALIRYDTSGHRKWVRTWDDPRHGNDSVVGLGCDTRGNAYLGAATWPTASTQEASVIKYSPAGKRVWQRRYKGTSGDGGATAEGFVVDGAGNAWIAGYFTRASSVRQSFAVKYAAGGKRRWVTRWSGLGSDPLGATTWDCALTGSRDLTLVGEVSTSGLGSIGSVLWLRR